MTFAAPWALFGLLLLPLIWWWARRRSQPTIVPLPSLMFLLEEDERLHAPRKRVLDWETRVALVALTVLIFAAAGPGFERGEPGRRVRIVRTTVPAGPLPAGADRGEARMQAALEAIRKPFTAEDEWEVVDVEQADADQGVTPLPSWDAIYAAARGADADLRIILTDRMPDDPPEDLHFVGIGTPTARNLAWVAATLFESDNGRPVVHAVLRNQGSEATTYTLRWNGEERPSLRVPAGAHQTVMIPLPATPDGETTLTVKAMSPDADERARDNAVRLRLRPLRVGYGAQLPAAHAKLFRDCLGAALGSLGVEEAQQGPRDLWIGTSRDELPSARLRLIVEPLDAGQPGRAAPAGFLEGPTDPRTRDLHRTGARFVYRADASSVREGERVLLGLTNEGTTWPVLAVRQSGVLRLAPDPLAGAPTPAETAFMPLLLSNLVGGVGQVGLERRGLEHPERSHIGSFDGAFDPAWLRGAPAGRGAERLDLRRPLILLGALLLLLLWLLPGRLEAWAATQQA